MRLISTFLLIISLNISLLSFPLLAQDATSGLYVCTDDQGMNNIVTQAQLASQTGNCRPYQKGMLSGHPTNNFSQAAQPSSSTNALDGFGRRVPLNNQILPATENIAATKPSDPNIMKAPSDTAPPSQSNTTPVSLIYMCPLADGSQTIIETDTPPNENCISFGVKGGGEAPAKTQASTDNTTSKTAEVSAEIATLDTPPQDIYKCFDHQGRATYVGENERHKFKQCSFFSRSFAGVEAELKRRAVSTQTLTQLAISGVNAPQLPSAKAAIKCSGAGEVIFNGEVKTYNCASRSFDYSPGSTGGSVQLGAQQATIAAHRLDYFDSAGSCGGTVLAENGRILHLEPTKECPEAFKIEARRIAAVVEKSLSINVSGAFKDRQRGLAAQINEIATNIGVDPFLVHAVISAESAYKSRAISHAGAQGLMQLMPATASRFGVTDPFNTGQNIRGGTTYLKWLLQEFNGNLELAIAGYNAGEGNVRKYGYKIPPFIETRAYVPKVLEYYRRYRANPSEVGL